MRTAEGPVIVVGGGVIGVCTAYYLTRSGLESAAAEIPLQEAHGYQTRTVNGGELLEREPHLQKAAIGGVFFPDAATLDPKQFLDGLAMLGLALGPVNGKLLAEWILGGQAPAELVSLGPARF